MPLPVTNGRITALFGPTNERLDSGGINKGLDIGVPVGTPVSAVAGGTVIAVGDQGDGWGISVKVRDAQGNVHNYGHLSGAQVRVGDSISPGQQVALSGNTGASTGPHVSYDVLGSGGSYIDPSPFLGFNAAGDNRVSQALIGQDVSALGAVAQQGGASASQSSLNPQGTDWGAMADQYGQIVQTIFAAKPSLDEFQDQTIEGIPYPAQQQYFEALGEWQLMLTDSLATLQGLEQAGSGLVTLDDGTLITESQYASLDPSARAQVDAAIANRDANLTNSYRQTLNEIGLAEYDLSVNRVTTENQRIQDEFNNKIAALQTSLDYDNTNLRKAETEISRALNGMAESRGRAQLIQDAQREAVKYGTTGGQTSFTAADLGGAVGSLAQQAGIGAGQSVISYPGFTTMDPEGDMARFDEQFGVSGPIPGVPGLLTQPGALPQAPGLLSSYDIAIPNLLRPEPPSLLGGVTFDSFGRPQTSALNPLTIQPSRPSSLLDSPWEPTGSLLPQSLPTGLMGAATPWADLFNQRLAGR